MLFTDYLTFEGSFKKHIYFITQPSPEITPKNSWNCDKKLFSWPLTNPIPRQLVHRWFKIQAKCRQQKKNCFFWVLYTQELIFAYFFCFNLWDSIYFRYSTSRGQFGKVFLLSFFWREVKAFIWCWNGIFSLIVGFYDILLNCFLT